MITASTHCKMQLERLKNIVALGAFWQSSPGTFGVYRDKGALYTLRMGAYRLIYKFMGTFQ